MTTATSKMTTATSEMTTTTSEMTSDEQLRGQQEYKEKMERLALKIQAYFVRFLLIFQAVTQLYVSMHYLIDFAFQGLPSGVIWALKLWAYHLCFVGFVNWVCLIYFSNEYNPVRHGTKPATSSKDNPQTWAHKDVQNDHDNNTHNDDDTTQNADDHTRNRDVNTQNDDVKSRATPLPWSYCQRCQMDTPPRTRHCKKCRACMVRRDHHCELVGSCVGHWNQRYFVVLASYGLPICYIGAYITITYLYHHHPEGMSLWNYFIPVTFFQGVRGQVSALQTLLTYHAYMLVAFCPLCTIYLMSEISVIIQGKTMREVLKKMKHIKVSSNVSDNLRVVFGEHWWLNFIFPTHFFIHHDHNGVDFKDVVVEPVLGSCPSEGDKKEL